MIPVYTTTPFYNTYEISLVATFTQPTKHVSPQFEIPIKEEEVQKPYRVDSFTINRFPFDGKAYVFQHPINLTASYFGKGWVELVCKELDTYAAGESIKDALADFQENIADSYDLYVLDSPDKLSDSAIRYREKLQEILEVTNGLQS